MIIIKDKRHLTTSVGLGVPGLSVLKDLAMLLASEKDPDLFLMGPRRGTVNRFTIEDEAILGAARKL